MKPKTVSDLMEGNELIQTDLQVVIFDPKENCTYVIANGKAIKMDAPPSGLGKHIITWQDGKVVYLVKDEKQKIE
ncbi:uncharacterized protein DUF3954 [Neobacillus bataviensis]|uniref:Uncharacterized protein DUF3954 n=1 Tax=Neobacillus bataviensis TaxID=220685 RepID=A0A561CPT0_9BACI|nr:DUF3954 domain-containing protein [Neobacillus bataviensis]TWD93206.1 uncharacterized protein DUF3954 [Neobacillus bataviensis]